MKTLTKTYGIAALVALIFALGSCKKENDTKPEAEIKLTAHTWIVEEVIDYTDGELTVQYKRGAEDNADDHSMVRHRFNTDGSISYTDSFGNTGTDGTWRLLDNGKKLQIGWGILAVTMEDVVVTGSELSYKTKFDESSYTLWKFSPASN